MARTNPESPPTAPAEPAAPADPGATSELQQSLGELKQLLVDLPGKLRASVSDDDKRGIAEHVHGLFEKSGAFEPPPPKDGEEPDPTTEPESEPGKSEPEPGGESWARRVFGRW